MSNIPISKMNDKQLRNEVQLLRDELAIFKRKYEDIICNLDNDNFSSRLIKEKEGMKTSIEQTEKSITLQAEKIEGNTTKIGTLEVTAEAIESEVFEENADGTKTSRLTQTANEIYAKVSANYHNLNNQISSVSVKANGISSRVEDLENFKTSTFTQTAEGFTLDGEKTTFTGVIYLTDKNGDRRYSLFLEENDGLGEKIFLHSTSTDIPLILGDYDGNVYIGYNSDNNIVATRDWVQKNGGGFAKFG